jgi:hypothetical protein
MLWNKKRKKKKRQATTYQTSTYKFNHRLGKKGKKALGADPKMRIARWTRSIRPPPPISQSINDPYNLYSGLHESKGKGEKRKKPKTF